MAMPARTCFILCEIDVSIATRRWNHFTNEELKNNHDDLLRAEVGFPEISFVFQYISH